MKTAVKFVKTLWGVSPLQGNTPLDGGYGRLFKRIKADGFDAVETPVWLIADKAAFSAALAASGLGYVAMINTCTPPGDHNGSAALADHVASFERQVAEALAMPVRPLLINAHSGCDSWPHATALEYFHRALAVEAASGIVVCHESERDAGSAVGGRALVCTIARGRYPSRPTS